MAYKIKYKGSIEKDLKRLAKSQIKRILDGIEKKLKKSPYSGKKLSGDFKGLLRFRFGDYRVIYAILDDKILILRIGHRKDIYK